MAIESKKRMKFRIIMIFMFFSFYLWRSYRARFSFRFYPVKS